MKSLMTLEEALADLLHDYTYFTLRIDRALTPQEEEGMKVLIKEYIKLFHLKGGEIIREN